MDYTSNVWKSADGKIHAYLRYTDSKGQKISKHFCKSEWKKLKSAKEFVEGYAESAGLGEKKLTVNKLYEHYITERKMKLKSKYNIESVWRLYMKDTIGLKTVLNVKQADIRKWQGELLSHGLSNRYLGKIQDLLRTVFLFGVRYEYIERNPFMVENKTVDEQKHIVQHWTPQEFETFIQSADDPLYADFFTLLYWTGLRYGEGVALRISDFDSQHGTIDVNKTWDSVHKVDTSPKTRNSIRTVVCTNEVKMMLCERLKGYLDYYDYNDEQILFGYDKHLSPRTMQHAFERYIKKSGVKRINIHALRHSHVYLLRSLGFDAFDIAKRLGHTVEMVNEYYGQWFLEKQKTMVEKIDKFEEIATNLQQSQFRN